MFLHCSSDRIEFQACCKNYRGLIWDILTYMRLTKTYVIPSAVCEGHFHSHFFDANSPTEERMDPVECFRWALTVKKKCSSYSFSARIEFVEFVFRRWAWIIQQGKKSKTIFMFVFMWTSEGVRMCESALFAHHIFCYVCIPQKFVQLNTELTFNKLSIESACA